MISAATRLEASSISIWPPLDLVRQHRQQVGDLAQVGHVLLACEQQTGHGKYVYPFKVGTRWPLPICLDPLLAGEQGDFFAHDCSVSRIAHCRGEHRVREPSTARALHIAGPRVSRDRPPFGSPRLRPVPAEQRRRDQHQSAHPFGMIESKLQRYRTPQRKSDQVASRNTGIVHQRQQIVGVAIVHSSARYRLAEAALVDLAYARDLPLVAPQSPPTGSDGPPYRLPACPAAAKAMNAQKRIAATHIFIDQPRALDRDRADHCGAAMVMTMRPAVTPRWASSIAATKSSIG